MQSLKDALLLSTAVSVITVSQIKIFEFSMNLCFSWEKSLFSTVGHTVGVGDSNAGACHREPRTQVRAEPFRRECERNKTVEPLLDLWVTYPRAYPCPEDSAAWVNPNGTYLIPSRTGSEETGSASRNHLMMDWGHCPGPRDPSSNLALSWAAWKPGLTTCCLLSGPPVSARTNPRICPHSGSCPCHGLS